MTAQESDIFVVTDGDAALPQGFLAAGVHAGIKEAKKDVALLVSESEAHVAATFTSNRLAAAPVNLSRRRLASGKGRAIVVNSGNANACTGERGGADAEQMTVLTAAALGVDADAVYVCSTGLIGDFLPMQAIGKGIDACAAALHADGGADAAEAILTTDVSSKQACARLSVDGRPVVISGMAKGAGMIEPNMATMLAFLTTDAAVNGASLQPCLTHAVDMSFNRISVDGCESTNDSVFLMANGAAGNTPLHEQHPDWGAFCDAVEALALKLAWKIVEDGEGATKRVTVNVSGAASDDDARRVARSVANSILVKTSWYGGDPNWGRLADAIGFSGARVEESHLRVSYDSEVVLANGQSDRSRLKAWEKVLAQDRFSVNIDLGMGGATATLYTCDCSEAYVTFNSAYAT